MKSIIWIVTSSMLLMLGIGHQEATAQTQDLSERVIELRLTNGMKVFLVQRDAGPTVACQILFRSGSVHDPPGREGIARIIGRTWLTGAVYADQEKQRALGDLLAELDELDTAGEPRLAADKTASGTMSAVNSLIDRIKRLEYECDARRYFEDSGGGVMNVHVGPEMMRSSVRLPANMLESWLRVESQRMKDSLLSGFYQARDDLIREAGDHRGSSNDYFMEELLDAAFEDHPYLKTAFPDPVTIRSISRTDAVTFKRSHCTPANAVAAIVGDITPGKAIGLVEETFGALEPWKSEISKADKALEPRESGQRHIMIASEGNYDLAIGYYLPPQDSQDAVALDLIDEILTSGANARLYTNFVKPGTAMVAVTSSAPGIRWPSLWGFHGRPRKPHTSGDLLQSWDAEIAALSDQLVDTRVLERAKRTVKASFYKDLVSNTGIAERLLEVEAGYGDWKVLLHYLDKVNSVKPDDIQRVSRTYLTAENRVIVEQVPVETGEEILEQ
ncbi:M16 family metallopeptidase [Acidobacteriota bacterium]